MAIAVPCFIWALYSGAIRDCLHVQRDAEVVPAQPHLYMIESPLQLMTLSSVTVLWIYMP